MVTAGRLKERLRSPNNSGKSKISWEGDENVIQQGQLGGDAFRDVQGADCSLEKDSWVTGITSWIRVNNDVLL